MADRVVRSLAAPVRGIRGGPRISASVGAACTNDPELEPAALLRAADMAMYAAKRAGGNRYLLADSGDADVTPGSRPQLRSAPAPGPAPRW